jgi:hypothetical protein
MTDMVKKRHSKAGQLVGSAGTRLIRLTEAKGCTFTRRAVRDVPNLLGLAELPRLLHPKLSQVMVQMLVHQRIKILLTRTTVPPLTGLSTSDVREAGGHVVQFTTFNVQWTHLSGQFLRSRSLRSSC